MLGAFARAGPNRQATAIARELHRSAAWNVTCAHQRRRRLAAKDETSDGDEAAAGRVVGPSHPAWTVLRHSSLRVTRQVEMLNVFLGYEQANRYTLVDPQGRTAGFMVEERSLASEIGRQIYRLHRPFRVLVMDANGSVCLEIRRGFSFINSRISVVDSAGTVIGESQQEWHPWRRRYNLFTQSEQKEFDQFARVDAPFLSWDFPMVDEHGAALGGVFRGFAGIGTELFTDYGLYSLCLSRAALEQRAAVESAARSGRVAGLPLAEREMDLDRRAVALAAAVSIDFDYFSRHSRFGAGAPLGITLFPLSSANHGGHPSDPGDSGAHDGYDEF